MKKRILHIGPIPPEIGGRAAGGIATHCWELASQSRRRGYEVHIFAGTDSSYNHSGVNIIGVPVKNKMRKACRAAALLPSTASGLLSFLSLRERLRVLSLASSLKMIVAEVDPEIIHLHSLLNFSGLSLSVLRLPCPVVATNYELWFGPQDRRKSAMANRTVASVSRLIHISEYTRERAQKIPIRFSGPSRVIYIPVRGERVPLLNREEVRARLNLTGGKTVFFYGIYRAVTKKGLDLLVEAFSLLPRLRESCRLIIRTGEEGAAFARDAFQRYGIEGRILGQISGEQMAAYYNAADLFVMPSRSEGYGIAYLEALLAGTPVVGFHRTLTEIEKELGNSVGGKFDAENEDGADLGRKMLEVMSVPFERKRLRAAVIENFSWEKRFPEYERFYEEVAR